MKLMFCPRCGDMIKLFYTKRQCMCGLCSGYYNSDGHTAVITNGIGIGISNPSFRKALFSRPEEEVNKADRDKINTFDAWVTPLIQPRIQQINTVTDVYSGSLHLEKVTIDPKTKKIVQSGNTMCGINFWKNQDIHWSIWYNRLTQQGVQPRSEDDIIEIAKKSQNVCPTCQIMAKRLRSPMKRAAVISFKNF